jgi:TPR repeat protein
VCDLHGNTVNDPNKFALVPRPSNAVGKAALGAKRILSGMIADTLALVSERGNAEVEGWVEKGTNCFTPGNYAEGLKWYRKAAERNHAKAQCFVGICCMHGWGIAEDEVEGVKWLHKSAELGWAEAQRLLGDFYRGKQDDISAIKWYRKAAEQGDFSCQSELGDCFHDGRGVPKDYVEAVKWYRKAADQNLSTAQCTLGCCYRDGQGVAQDYHEAAKWYRLSAENGWAMAQYYLGLCYADGKGVAQNYKEAACWYRKAADQGFSDAQEILGAYYANGQATIDIEDAVDAYKYVRIAEDKGYDGATKTMAVLSALLSPDELREAESRYQEICARKNRLFERVSKIMNGE